MQIIVIKLLTTEKGTKLQKEQSFQCKIVMRVAEGGRMEWYNPAIQKELAAEGNEIINFILRTHVRRQESRQKRESYCLQSWKNKKSIK